MRNPWKILLAVLAVGLGLAAPVWASVPRVVMVEDFTATW
jgi:hypothetical protein